MSGLSLVGSGRNFSVPCVDCGVPTNSARIEVDEFEYCTGGKNVVLQVDVEVHTCDECGLEFTTEAAEDARHNAVCDLLQVQKPSDIKAIRSLYEMSRSQMAQISGIGEASLARWESGSLIQSGGYDNFLYLMQFADNMMRLQQRNISNHNENEFLSDRNWSFEVTKQVRIEQSSFSLVSNVA